MKLLLKKYFPAIYSFLIKRKLKINLLTAYWYDYKRYIKYSGTIAYNSSIKLESLIIKEYHIIEKGLTMPETKVGFGQEKIINLCKDCLYFYNKYPLSDQIKHSIGVILEYEAFHKAKCFSLNLETIQAINSVKEIAIHTNIIPTSQYQTSRKEYFKTNEMNFPYFSNSRRSIRNFDPNINISTEELEKICKLCLNTPSACNRQTSRIHIYTDKNEINNILKVQDGCKGFGHLTNKLIVITAELGAFAYPMERYQAYIDGGMFAMNMLYAIHYNKIGACILNCSHNPIKDKNIRKVCMGINESEIFIAMIACGVPPESFSITTSKRYSLNEVYKIN